MTASIEPFFWFAMNTQRELLFDSSKDIVQRDSIDVAKDSIFQMYDQNNVL